MDEIASYTALAYSSGIFISKLSISSKISIKV